MRRILPLAVFLAALPAAAAEPPSRLPAVSASLATNTTFATLDEGIWAWVGRMDGEVLPEEAMEAMEEAADAAAAERALLDEGSGVDLAEDLYDDPAAALTGDPLHLDKVDPSEFDIPIEINAHVEKWMKILLGPQRKYLVKWLERKARYEPFILEELDKAGMPRDLVYLSMIESGFNPYAYSHAHAAGLWQFIPSTGREYKLRIDWWVDERRDPELSTRAAIAFLQRLHQMFDDWHLAFAAYNTGPGRVKRTLERTGARTYWDLVAQDALHRETQGYVPKIIAAAIIGKHPERYGLADLSAEPRFTFDVVEVEGSVDLAVLARCAGISEDDFRLLNPQLRRFATPDGHNRVRVPQAQGEAFVAALAEVPDAERRRIVQHTVRPGESLSGIATTYKVSLDQLVQANRITNPNRIHPGMTLIVPVNGEVPVVDASSLAAARSPSGSSASSSSASAPAAPPRTSAAPATYTVKPGDSLSMIAERHGLRLATLQALNNIRDPSKIVVGQVLKLGEGAAARPASEPAPVVLQHTVKAGESLSGIADRYGVPMQSLQRDNNIKDASTIRVGQKLTVRAEGSDWSNYTVKAGDSLGIIAQRHKVSIDDLKSWNRLGGATIHPGQVLRIRTVR